MTSEAQLQSNRRNAQLCTGPKSEEGKLRSSRNAIRHGLRSELTIIPGENAADWESHREGIAAALAPVGILEMELAERIALLLWRLRRATRYEAAVVSAAHAATVQKEFEWGTMSECSRQLQRREDVPRNAHLQKAEEELLEFRERASRSDAVLEILRNFAKLPANSPVTGQTAWHIAEAFANAVRGKGGDPTSEKILRAAGVPPETIGRAYDWDGWNVGMVRTILTQYATANKEESESILHRATRDAEEEGGATRKQLQGAEAKVENLRQWANESEAHELGKNALLKPDTCEKLIRYEAHVGRQLTTMLHTLERIQAVRAGAAVVPPVVVDVNVNGMDSVSMPATDDQLVSFGSSFTPDLDRIEGAGVIYHLCFRLVE